MTTSFARTAQAPEKQADLEYLCPGSWWQGKGKVSTHGHSTLVIRALRSLRQGDQTLKASVRHMTKLHLKNKQKSAGKMAQWVEGLLSSLMTGIQVSRNHTVKGENNLLKAVL